MTDPAVEAAMRVLDVRAENRIAQGAAARAALAPIRALHRPLWYLNRQHCCGTCFDGDGMPEIWPCSTALFCYTTDEIKEMTNE